MTRRAAPPRKVEALASECRALLAWLKGPGSCAAPETFATVLQSYRALVDAVAMLPRGPQCLRQARALPPVRRAPRAPDTTRPADAFSIDELATMREGTALLTPTGWVVAAPLLPHVDAVRVALGPESTDKDALVSILQRKAATRGESVLATVGRELGALQKRVSVLRARARANAQAGAPITDTGEKVPPGDS